MIIWYSFQHPTSCRRLTSSSNTTLVLDLNIKTHPHSMEYLHLCHARTSFTCRGDDEGRLLHTQAEFKVKDVVYVWRSRRTPLVLTSAPGTYAPVWSVLPWLPRMWPALCNQSLSDPFPCRLASGTATPNVRPRFISIRGFLRPFESQVTEVWWHSSRCFCPLNTFSDH